MEEVRREMARERVGKILVFRLHRELNLISEVMGWILIWG